MSTLAPPPELPPEAEAPPAAPPVEEPTAAPTAEPTCKDGGFCIRSYAQVFAAHKHKLPLS